MKKLMKKWWFWALILVVIIGISNMGAKEEDIDESDASTAITEAEVPEPTAAQVDDFSEADKDGADVGSIEDYEQIQPQTPQEIIEQAAEDIVADLQTTTLHDVKVNKHAGTDDPDDFIVLIYLSFDAKNRANTVKNMIDLYNNEIGARLVDISEIAEITTFWEVPYLLEGQNVAKANMERSGDGMAFKDTWYDGRVFE